MDKPLDNEHSKDETASKRWRVRFSRRSLIVGSLAVVILAAASVVAYHQHVWDRSIESSELSYAEIAESAKAGFINDDLDAEDMGGFASDVEAAANQLCGRSFLADLRMQLLESAREQQEDCKERIEKLLEVVAAANSLRSWLEVEKEITDVYGQTREGLGQVSQGDYSARQKIWRQARASIDQISDRGFYQEQKVAQVAAIDGVISSYDDLIEADETKQRPQFDAAVKKLQEAYDNLSATADTAKHGYRLQAEGLGVAIETL